MAGARSRTRGRKLCAFHERADRLGLTLSQALAVAGTLCCGLLAYWAWGSAFLVAAMIAVQCAFLTCAVWRVALVSVSRPTDPYVPDMIAWPRYTVLVALHDEAEMMDQLVERLARIEYPPDRLEGLLLLEAHDLPTIEAAERAARPAWLKISVVPAGGPATKPRALNHGLALATGDLLVVYDAEDDPDPVQLREAAARFAANGDATLACLQAPLRIRRLDSASSRSTFLDRQFAAEYAALFEVVLPGIVRFGLPFPLGGTSNHFRVDALRAVNGWDAHNVTEDADLAFRLWRAGRRQGMLARPTYEPPPGDLDHWLPQRTRWIKGFMQTWGVHTRSLRDLGWRGALSLVMTIGAAIAAAAVHAVSLAWVLAAVAVATVAGLPPATPVFAIGVLAIGAASAWLTCIIGARRANIAYGLWDMLAAPFYWAMLTLAFAHAVWRLVREPHAWDKTTHRPDVPIAASVGIDARASTMTHRRLSRGQAKLRR